MQQRDVVMSEAWSLVWNTNMSAMSIDAESGFAPQQTDPVGIQFQLLRASVAARPPTPAENKHMFA